MKYAQLTENCVSRDFLICHSKSKANQIKIFKETPLVPIGGRNIWFLPSKSNSRTISITIKSPKDVTCEGWCLATCDNCPFIQCRVGPHVFLSLLVYNQAIKVTYCIHTLALVLLTWAVQFFVYRASQHHRTFRIIPGLSSPVPAELCLPAVVTKNDPRH